ncbi:hypothetical protein GA0115240_107715 [Streptomyces sp. DvalAA-14]|uniref:hypothetical protein n=1 Tax=unclassified Streptomyces TaxID=2593676 RepID=UPI00081B6265|nr:MULTISPECIES: hypothetical protein [unclassified Streptomyces]MYS19381.1 hypothetical protein [Streptomyces sp. SID4948]SCD43196.1 hypothetical protein GA0115240_107715 [Streptomyces sp. DvalAA-14]
MTDAPSTQSPARPRRPLLRALPPGRELSPATERWLIAGLVAALPDLRVRRLFELRHDMITDAEQLVCAVDPDSNRAVGLLAAYWTELASGRSCLHVTVQFIGDSYRHGSIFRRSWAELFTRLRDDGHGFPDVVALKTYNPVVHCAMSAFGAHPDIALYPALDPRTETAPVDPRLVAEAARAVAPGARLDADRGVIRGIGLPLDLYRRRPVSSVADVDAYFGANLAPGDRILCLLHFRTPAGKQAVLTALGVS